MTENLGGSLVTPQMQRQKEEKKTETHNFQNWFMKFIMTEILGGPCVTPQMQTQI